MDNEDIEYEIMQDDNIIKENIVIKENNKEIYNDDYLLTHKYFNKSKILINKYSSSLLLSSTTFNINYQEIYYSKKDELLISTYFYDQEDEERLSKLEYAGYLNYSITYLPYDESNNQIGKTISFSTDDNTSYTYKYDYRLSKKLQNIYNNI